MKSLNYVIGGDKSSVVISQASDLLTGKMTIGESLELIDELINYKQYFCDFYGQESNEYMIAKELLNIVRMIGRSIRFQKESERQKIKDWVAKFPIRTQYVKRLEGLIG
jgi:hypothetical protein